MDDLDGRAETGDSLRFSVHGRRFQVGLPYKLGLFGKLSEEGIGYHELSIDSIAVQLNGMTLDTARRETSRLCSIAQFQALVNYKPHVPKEHVARVKNSAAFFKAIADTLCETAAEEPAYAH